LHSQRDARREPPVCPDACMECGEDENRSLRTEGTRRGDLRSGGMLTFKDADFRARLRQQTGAAAVGPAHFYAFSDPEENVWEQIQRIKSHPWIPKHIPVRGFIYDVRSGRLREVRIATDTNAPWR
jgi:hypothetical protein